MSRRLGHRPTPQAAFPSRLAAINLLLVGVLLLATAYKVSLVFPQEINQAAFEKILPVGAVEYLREQRPPGRLFNSYNWGGYLLWALTEYPVFVDGRTDLYDDEIIGQWLKVARAEAGWQQVLEEYGANLVLIEVDSNLDRELRCEDGWQQIYRDELAALHQRVIEPNP
jgi:hypothetical protein